MLWGMGYNFDRAYYRLVYPTALRPTFRTGGRVYPVVDLSEEGARLLFSEGSCPDHEADLAGTIGLPGGESISVKGRVVRVDAPFASLRLSQGVPFGVMMDQQRFLQHRLVGWR